jgi:hypothetical protein
MCRRGFPLVQRWIPDRLGLLPSLHTFRPTDFGSLIAGLSDGIKRNGAKPAFLFGKTENVVMNPIFQAERQRPVPGRFGCQLFFVLEKSRKTVRENLNQPIRDAILDFQNRANPEVKLLPGDVLVSSLEQSLPRNAAGFLVGACARESLQSIGQIAPGVASCFLQAAVPKGSRQRSYDRSNPLLLISELSLAREPPVSTSATQSVLDLHLNFWLHCRITGIVQFGQHSYFCLYLRQTGVPASLPPIYLFAMHLPWLLVASIEVHFPADDIGHVATAIEKLHKMLSSARQFCPARACIWVRLETPQSLVLKPGFVARRS